MKKMLWKDPLVAFLNLSVCSVFDLTDIQGFFLPDTNSQLLGILFL